MILHFRFPPPPIFRFSNVTVGYRPCFLSCDSCDFLGYGDSGTPLRPPVCPVQGSLAPLHFWWSQPPPPPVAGLGVAELIYFLTIRFSANYFFPPQACPILVFSYFGSKKTQSHKELRSLEFKNEKMDLPIGLQIYKFLKLCPSFSLQPHPYFFHILSFFGNAHSGQ